MAILNLLKSFGSGGSGLTPNDSAGAPSLRRILAALAGLVRTVPRWESGVAVAGDTVTMPNAGLVLAVEATTASSTGPKQMQDSGSPAAGTVQVVYDAAGIPTLNFNGQTSIGVLRDKGRNARLIIYPGVGRGFDFRPENVRSFADDLASKDSVQRAARFMRQHLLAD